MAANERNAGFIFLHRSLRDHWLWKDPVKLQWWVDILMECNHEDKKVSIGYQLIECKRGETINSLITWAKRWRTNRSTVYRFLELLKSDSMIATESVQKTTRITVCNYSTYNDLRNNTGTKQKQSRNNSETILKRDSTQTKNELKNEEEDIGAKAPASYKLMTEKEFYESIAAFKGEYPKDMLRKFYDYWREPSPSGKMLFQLKKTWSLNLRLKRWQANGFDDKKKPEQPAPTSAPLQILKPL